MKKVVVTLPKYHLANRVLINGQNLIFKKNKVVKLYVAEYYCEEDEIQLSLDMYNPLNKWNWWLLGMLFFFISFFGIFDTHDKNGFIYCYNATITLNEGDNVINLVPKRGRDKVLEATVSCKKYDETINTRDYDKKIRRRNALLIVSKILFIIILIAVLIILIFILGISALNWLAGK